MLHIRLLSRSRVLTSALVAGAIAGASPLHAQTAPVREDSSARALLSSLVVPFVNDNERREDVQARAEQFVLGIRSGVALGISTVPLGTGSAGFAFVRDPATGERLLKSDSFGPVFLDRPLTSGKGQFGFGFHYQHMSFDKLQGVDLRDEGIPTFNNESRFLQDNFVQYIDERLLIDSTADVFVLSSTFGVTDALDIGVTVPIVSLDLSAQRVWNYDVSRDYADQASVRASLPAPAGQLVQDSRHVSATGVGDVAVRVKYAFGHGTKQPVAAALDLRLPTGDEDNLLGTGKIGAKLQLLAAHPVTSFMNVYGAGGYTFNDISNQVNYGASVDFVLLPRKQLTVSFDLVGETLMDTVTDLETVPAYAPVEALGAVPSRGLRRTTFDRYFFDTGSLSIARAGVGAKYHLGGNVLLTGSVLFPLTDNGFSAGVTPFIGIEKTWVR